MRDTVRVTVAIHHGNNGDTKAAGLGNSNVLLVGIDDEQHTGKACHLLDAAERSLELRDLAFLGDLLLLGENVKAPLFPIPLKLVEAIDGGLHRLVVGKHSTEPAVSNPILASASGSLSDQIRSLTLGANKEHLLAARDGRADEVAGLPKLNGSLLQIDDVNAVLLPENVRLHLRVPSLGLVTKVNAGVEQVFKSNCRHRASPVVPPHAPQATCRGES